MIPLALAVQIITFDRGGVTGHKNHMSCWQAVRYLRLLALLSDAVCAALNVVEMHWVRFVLSKKQPFASAGLL